MTTQLTATSIGCSAGGQLLFRGLDLVVDAGDVVEIVGDNGIGKSTLLRVLAGLAEPAEGTIERPAAAHYLGHRAAIVGVMSPLENLRHAAALAAARPSTDDISRALAQLGLWSARHKPCQALSAGQQRRVALAELVASACPVWLLDEPTTSLDAAGVALVAELIRTHAAAGGSVVAAIHGSLGVGARRVDLSRLIAAEVA